MKHHIHSLFAAALLGAIPAAAQTQPATKILVVDMVKLYDGHYKTAEQNAVWTRNQEEASAELQKMGKDLNDVVEQYKALDEQSRNTMLKDEVRAKAMADAQKKYAEMQEKNNQGVKYKNDFQTFLSQRIKTFRDIMYEEINKTAAEIAKKKGATFVVDKSAISATGIPMVIYFDPSYEITEEVMDQINRERPPAPAASTPPVLNVPPATPAAPKK